MALALAKLNIARTGPVASAPWTITATVYDTVALTFETKAIPDNSDAVVNSATLLKAKLDIEFGAINYTLAAPPGP